MPKPLLHLPPASLNHLQHEHETGMGFHLIDSPAGVLYVVLSDGAAMPVQPDNTYFDLSDLLMGVPVPPTRQDELITLRTSLPSRATASARLLGLAITPAYAGAAGAFPLIGSATLASSTVFFRYIQSAKDHRYNGLDLAAGTYLTTQLERPLANTGFAAVGRFALPLPLPACHVVHYELRAGTVLTVGTVSPLFGQAGGGVEVCLGRAERARVVTTSTVPEF